MRWCEAGRLMVGNVGAAGWWRGVAVACVLVVGGVAPAAGQFVSDEGQREAFAVRERERAAVEAAVAAWQEAVVERDARTIRRMIDFYLLNRVLRTELVKLGVRGPSLRASVEAEEGVFVSILSMDAAALSGLRLMKLERERRGRWRAVMLPFLETGDTADVVVYWFENRAGEWAVVDSLDSIRFLPTTQSRGMFYGEHRLVSGRFVASRLAEEMSEEMELSVAGEEMGDPLRIRLLERELAEAKDDDVRAFLGFYLGTRLLHAGRNEESVEALARVRRGPFGEVSGIGIYLEGLALFWLERYAESEARVRRAIELDGRVPLYLGTLASLRMERGDSVGAEALYTESLLGEPDDQDAMLGFAQNVPEVDAELWDRVVAGYVAPAASFELQAGLLWDVGLTDHLAGLTDAVARRHGEIAVVSLARSRLAFGAGEMDEAGRLADAAIQGAAHPEQRARFAAWRDQVRLALEGPAAVYREGVDDAAGFFRREAFGLYQAGDLDRLSDLLAARIADIGEAAGKSDHDVLMAMGDLAMLRETYDAAGTAYRRAWEIGDETQRDEARQGLVLAELERGAIEAAYRVVGELAANFTQAADWLEAEDDPAGLTELIALRRADDAYDPGIPWYEALAAQLMDDPAAEVAALNAARLAGVRAEQQAYLDRRLILAHLALDDLEAARREAARSKRRDGDPYYDMLIAAATRDAALMLETAAFCVDRLGYDPTSFWNDPVLAEALTGEEFAAFRDAYPPPEELEEGYRLLDE
ncbi:MAG: hypothetical protein AAF823_06490 [Planctomycetota bacterium]